MGIRFRLTGPPLRVISNAMPEWVTPYAYNRQQAESVFSSKGRALHCPIVTSVLVVSSGQALPVRAPANVV
jgi:hypothetical protein